MSGNESALYQLMGQGGGEVSSGGLCDQGGIPRVLLVMCDQGGILRVLLVMGCVTRKGFFVCSWSWVV